MIVRRRSVAVHVAVSAFMSMPVVLILSTIDSDTTGSLIRVVQNNWMDVRAGRLTEDLLLVVCVAVMAGAWLRITWVVFAVLWSVWRGRTPVNANRPLVRFVLRLLMLAPIAMNPTIPRSTAVAAAEPSEVGVHRPMSAPVRDSVSRDVVLVSIAVAVGIAWRLRHKRLESLRTSSEALPEGRVGEQDQDFEDEVARHGDEAALSRLYLAVRSLVAAGIDDFRWIVQHQSGLIHVECSKQSATSTPWIRVSDRIVALDAGVSFHELTTSAERDGIRIPVLLPIGTTRAGDVWVNLEAVGSFFVEGDGACADAVWAGICQSLSLSPHSTSISIVTEGECEVQGRRCVVVDDPIRAARTARTLHCPESPAVRMTTVGSRRMLCIDGLEAPSGGECGLVWRRSAWLLVPLHQDIEPVTCSSRDRQRIADLLDAPVSIPPSIDEAVPDRILTETSHPVVRRIASKVSFVARVMGRPSIDHIEFGEVVFERARSEELVIWLALHPQRRLRTIARTEMWNVPIKDSTFSNVTSDARRSLTACDLPPDGEQWLSVTLTDHLPLHERIVTDVSILEACIDHARRNPDDGGAEVLLFGLGFVRGSPFEGSRYMWRDTTGISTEIALLIVRAAVMAAEMCLEREDANGVFTSSAKGLLAVPGHEDLVALRMRQHARRGDRASVIAEWESYCRALVRDDWGDAAPSQKMVDLWSNLSGVTWSQR